MLCLPLGLSMWDCRPRRLAGRAEASAQGSVGGMATGAGAAAANAGAALSRRPCMLSKLFFTAGTRSQGTASRALLE